MNRSDLEGLPTDITGFPVIFGNSVVDFVAFYLIILLLAVSIILVIFKTINNRNVSKGKEALKTDRLFLPIIVTALLTGTVLVIASANMLSIETQKRSDRNEAKIHEWIAEKYGVTNLRLAYDELRFPYFDQQRGTVWLISDDGTTDYALVTNRDGSLELKKVHEIAE